MMSGYIKPEPCRGRVFDTGIRVIVRKKFIFHRAPRPISNADFEKCGFPVRGRRWTLLDGVIVKVWPEKETVTDGKINIGSTVRIEATSKYQHTKKSEPSFAIKFTIETKYDGQRCWALDPKRFIASDSSTPTEFKEPYLACVANSTVTDPAKRFKRFIGTLISSS